jgi:hypothetical protein
VEGDTIAGRDRPGLCLANRQLTPPKSPFTGPGRDDATPPRCICDIGSGFDSAVFNYRWSDRMSEPDAASREYCDSDR